MGRVLEVNSRSCAYSHGVVPIHTELCLFSRSYAIINGSWLLPMYLGLYHYFNLNTYLYPSYYPIYRFHADHGGILDGFWISQLKIPD